jgi:hypothetical protein
VITVTARLVTVFARVSRAAHDQLLLAAAEHGISPYAMHQQLLEAWAERRIKAGKPALAPASVAMDAPAGTTDRSSPTRS